MQSRSSQQQLRTNFVYTYTGSIEYNFGYTYTGSNLQSTTEMKLRIARYR